MTIGALLTILGALVILVSTLAAAFTLGRGLPETMRALALWLLVYARRIEAWRSAADSITRQALEAEATQ